MNHRQVRVTVLLGVLAIGLTFGVAEAVHLVHNGRYGSLSPACRIQTDRKVVALTFDDGPDPDYTPDILQLLQDTETRASFFVIGQHAEMYPALVRDELSSGMEIGNHTWSHLNLVDLSASETTQEVAATADWLSDIGSEVSLFRAPYGAITPAQLEKVAELGLRPVHWSVPLDHYIGGMGLTPRAAAMALALDIQPGDIILAHDAHDGSIERESAVATLRILLPELRKRGFEVTTVSNLFRQGAIVRAKPRTWVWQSGFTCPDG